MEIRFPDFSDPYLMELGYCCRLNVPNGWDMDSKRSMLECRYGEGFWCRVISEKWRDGSEGKWHLHVAFRRRFGETKRAAKDSDLDVVSLLANFAGWKGNGPAHIEYRVPETEIPQRGLIRAFLGLSTSHGGMKLSFSGATLSIADDIFDELSWKFEDSTLSAALDATIEYLVDADCFVRAEQFLKGGIRGLILEAERGVGDSEGVPDDSSSGSESTYQR